MERTIMSEVTFADVLTYVATTATADEVKALFAAGNARVKAVRAANAAVVSGLLEPGTSVELVNIRPAYLNGLTGTFVRLNDGRGKQRAIVQLDAASAAKAGRYAPDGKLAGVPVSALKIVA
jgi:hypothetical protein